MRKLFGIAAFTFMSLTASVGAQETCGQAAFAAVVNEASAQLTAMNEENRKSFQAKLQVLKVRENWADADYVAKATPFVQDEQIAVFDTNGKALLAKVELLGQPGQVVVTASVATPLGKFDRETAVRCSMLEDLRGLMAQVVENTRAKWQYMHGKIDGTGDSVRQAKAQ
jgi:hypothetical protein